MKYSSIRNLGGSELKKLEAYWLFVVLSALVEEFEAD
jgi:hypothetical protein